jgi:hypothetical protein
MAAAAICAATETSLPVTAPGIFGPRRGHAGAFSLRPREPLGVRPRLRDGTTRRISVMIFRSITDLGTRKPQASRRRCRCRGRGPQGERGVGPVPGREPARGVGAGGAGAHGRDMDLGAGRDVDSGHCVLSACAGAAGCFSGAAQLGVVCVDLTGGRQPGAGTVAATAGRHGGRRGCTVRRRHAGPGTVKAPSLIWPAGEESAAKPKSNATCRWVGARATTSACLAAPRRPVPGRPSGAPTARFRRRHSSPGASTWARPFSRLAPVYARPAGVLRVGLLGRALRPDRPRAGRRRLHRQRGLPFSVASARRNLIESASAIASQNRIDGGASANPRRRGSTVAFAARFIFASARRRFPGVWEDVPNRRPASAAAPGSRSPPAPQGQHASAPPGLDRRLRPRCQRLGRFDVDGRVAATASRRRSPRSPWFRTTSSSCRRSGSSGQSEESQRDQGSSGSAAPSVAA